MKNYYLFFLILCYLFIGCSDEENPVNNQEENANIDYKYLKSIEGEDHMLFEYENGRLIKGLGNSDMDRDVFHGAFQVEYNSNNQVVQVIEYFGSLSKSEGFNFDLTTIDGPGNISYHNYVYSNGKLSSIKKDGELRQEFVYDSEGKVNQYIALTNGAKHIFDFIYNENGIMEGFDLLNTENGQSLSVQIESDNHTNPFYVFWKEHSFFMPYDMGSISDENFAFYPHNILEVKKSGEIEYSVEMRYNEDYPISYDINIDFYGDRDPMSINYISD